MENKQERFRATLLCSAVGDSLGMPVEGWKREQIKRYAQNGRITQLIDPILIKDAAGNLVESDELGKLKYYGKDLKRGEWTDDTILTLALAESIAERGELILDDVAAKHLKEFQVRRLPDGSILGGFGKTTTDAMNNLEKGISARESGVIGGPGNAPCMKMAPVGLYMSATGRYNKGLDFAYDVSRITHLDPRSIASGVVQADAVYSLLEGTSKEQFLSSLEKVCETFEDKVDARFSLHDKGSLLSRISWIYKNRDATSEEAFLELGNTSMVYKSYPFALFMFQKYWNDPLAGLIETVNYGGDCDTTGAIYGALAGAKNGNFVPDNWLAILKDRTRIIDISDKIYSLRN